MATMALTQQAIVELSGGTSTRLIIFAAIRIVVAILLLAGLWTSIAGALMAVLQLWSVYGGAGDLWLHIRLGTLGVALVLLGPGAWSVDARLFGWKRIDIRDRKS
jgi:uncharacterized membrane protein YphA (DoxX/SURF4 family)